MGERRMVEGEWTDISEMTDENGEFQRSETSFRDEIDEVESGRYHLYISRACPWAHGAVLIRKILGLEDQISMDIVDPWRGEKGWQFSPGKDEVCSEDSIHGHNYLYQVYTEADSDYTGRVTVPVLWDRKRGYYSQQRIYRDHEDASREF